MPVDLETLARIARRAGLARPAVARPAVASRGLAHADADGRDALLGEVQIILHHVEQLMNVDTAGVAPTVVPVEAPPPEEGPAERARVEVEPATLRRLFVDRDGDALLVPAPAAGVSADD